MPEYDKVNEKTASDWAAAVGDNCITRDHILKAYRLHLKSCSGKPNPCKRNCSNNPKCITGLGENRLFNHKEGASINLEDEERREPGSFAGLKNLGATCYVNSQLQVWYHNPFLREAIYKWKPEDDEKEISAQLDRAVSLTDLTSGSQFSPVSPVGQLQLIFARLQFSARRYVDPTQFVNSLQLDVSQQQDAQEFSKLFLTLLEDDLASQKDSKVKNIVQTQYCGEYDYVTRCSNCGTESFSPSKFYELSLNIRGHKDIHQCLDEFFSPEILEGSNQYYCNICEGKQNVIRTIRLRKCPPYLNLQLLRFIYDRQKNCRRKLNSSINFPLTMDMKKYFQESVSVDCTEYNLVAVLVHKGQSAHSGHYIAHIKDRETGDWYKFNDEFVERTQGKVIKLCTDNSKESNTSKASSGTPPLPLGEIKPSALNVPSPFTSVPTASTLSSTSNNRPTKKESSKFSKGSYMLVYKNAVLDDKKLPPDSSVQWDIPEYLQTLVVEENSIFEDHLEIKRKERDQRLAINREKQKEILSIYKKLIITDKDEPFEWINKNWLKDWLHSDFENPIPPLDNSNALCPHNKLSLKAAHSMKCVNSEGASILFSLYSGQFRLIDALCRQCVELKVNPIPPTQVPPMPKLNVPLVPVISEFSPVSDNKDALKCIHQRPLYPPSEGIENSDKKRDVETNNFIEQNNQETVTMRINGMNDENVDINDSAHCKPCFDQLVEKEMEKLLNYKDAKIYVRKIQNELDDQQDPDAEDDSYDSSFQGQVTRKRMKSQQEVESHSIQSFPSSSPKNTPRRSTRRRKYRDEREFTVSSLQTLLSLKIEIMHDFKVAPYDQDLFLNEVPLQGNDRTLAELKIVPNSLIYLKVDEPSCSGSSLMEEDYIKDHPPETGFKGTQLQKC